MNLEIRQLAKLYGDTPVFQNVSLSLGPGEFVAIVGQSGSGKSTIGRLLFRFYDVTAGAVRIDGQDLRDVTQDSLHAQIGVVPQDTVLFNDTVYYNIAYGNPDAGREAIPRVAKPTKVETTSVVFFIEIPVNG